MESQEYFDKNDPRVSFLNSGINCDPAIIKMINFNSERCNENGMKTNENNQQMKTEVPQPHISPNSETSEPDCVSEEFPNESEDSVDGTTCEKPSASSIFTTQMADKHGEISSHNEDYSSQASTTTEDDDDDGGGGGGGGGSENDSSNDSDDVWKPKSLNPFKWLQRQQRSGRSLRELLPLMATNFHSSTTFWSWLSSMVNSCPPQPRRRKLAHINTFDDVIRLLRSSEKIIVLTGAGVSVSCGIPDFRSSNGVYSRLAKDYPDLPNPQAMFDIEYFSRDPRPFFKFAREIYPGQFKPSPCHRFIKLLETKGKLLRNFSQNIDTLERVAGIQNVVECHGSFSTASCTKCKLRCSADHIREDIFAQRIPVCHRCQPNVHQSVDASVSVSESELRELVQNGIMKPDIVFFNEGLPDEFHKCFAKDKNECDLLIVIGSSLKVRPVATIPDAIPANVPQVLINREQLNMVFDVELLGDSDVIVNQLCHRLGEEWSEICFDVALTETKKLLSPEPIECAASQQDIETQSNASAIDGAATGSDSGFESSTCNRARVEIRDEADGIETDYFLSSNCNWASKQTQSNKYVTSNNIDSSSTSVAQSQQLPCQSRAGSIADSLSPGTYYCSKNGYCHIFPGAQVTFDGGYNEDDVVTASYESDSDDDLDFAVCSSNAECPMSPLLNIPEIIEFGKENLPNDELCEVYNTHCNVPTVSYNNSIATNTCVTASITSEASKFSNEQTIAGFDAYQPAVKRCRTSNIEESNSNNINNKYTQPAGELVDIHSNSTTV